MRTCVDGKSTGGVDDDHVVLLGMSLGHTLGGRL